MCMKKIVEAILGWCTKRAILRDKPTVVAIAGSVGKTSTRNALTLALASWLKPEELRTSLKNFNNEIGVPLSVFGHDAPGKNVLKWLAVFWDAFLYAFGFKHLNVRYLILEMGADHPGDLAYLISIAPPDSVVMTAVGAEHTEYFGTSEKAIEEELSLLRSLPQDGMCLLNSDDENLWPLKVPTQAECIGFGKNSDSVVRILDTKVIYNPEDPESSGLEVEFDILKYISHRLFLKGVYGEGNAYAITAAVLFMVSNDMMDDKLKPAIKYIQNNFQGMPGRNRIISGIKKTVILDDSYNAQPQAMRMALLDLAHFPVSEGGRRIAALGDMLELGDLAKDEHEKIGKLAAELKIDFLVCCGKLAQVIASAAQDAGMLRDRIYKFDNSSEAGLFIQQEILQPNDAVLVKGSQSMRMERITKELMAEPLKAKDLLVRQSEVWQKR